MLNKELTVHDYALVKITESVELQNFIGLSVNYNIGKEKLAVFGYPAAYYYNTDKSTNI